MIVDFLILTISDYRRAHPERIHRVGGGSGYRLYLPTMLSDRHPDIAVALKGTPKDTQGRRPPSLVIEVVSKGTEARHRDYVLKREEYLAYGLLEYWIVDPFERKVTVLLREDGRWIERVFAGDQAAEGLVLPGLRVPLAGLWAAGDEEPPAAR
jgi:Uma2 family endonuclease